MRVLHFFYEINYSGAEIMYYEAASFFKSKGIRLYAINSMPKLGNFVSKFVDRGFEVAHLPAPPFYNVIGRIFYYYKIILFLKRNKIDVVHIHTNGLLWGISMCARVVGVKSVYTFHNVFYTSWYKWVYKFLQRWIAKNLWKCQFQSISDSVHDHEEKYFFNKTKKIYNWYANERFYPGELNEKVKLRQALGLANDAFIIISIGRCTDVKNHSDIIKVLPELKLKYPNVIYLHIGEGESLNKEIQLAKELEVYENIFFVGVKKDVRPYLIASDLYIMPSKFEGISLTTIEALACKIPAVLYDVPGLKDFNSEMECSKLVKPNLNSLIKGIIEIRDSLDYRNKLVANGKEFVTKNYNLQINARKIYELYK